MDHLRDYSLFQECCSGIELKKVDNVLGMICCTVDQIF